MMEQEYKYYAFISYNKKDTEWGKRVQRKLEHYRMPATLCSEKGWKRKPINPVFFAPTDIQPGGLTEELQERLRASRNLIVICSPNSAQSEWVGKEIEYFHSLGRTDSIHFFIVDGSPNSADPATECFNPVIKKLDLPEILGANINEKIYRWAWLNKERAYVQLVSKLLGVEFDTIWKRHQRRLISRIIAWTLGAIIVLAALVGVWITNQPIDAHMSLNEATVHNEQLPPLENAIVSLTLDNEVKVDTIATMDAQAVFTNIPHRYLGKEAHITLSCQGFQPMDTTVTLDRNVTLHINRDPDRYGKVRFTLWNPLTEVVIPNVTIDVAGHSATSSPEGLVELFIPLQEQRRAYPVKAPFALEQDSVFMPCGENDVISKK